MVYREPFKCRLNDSFVITNPDAVLNDAPEMSFEVQALSDWPIFRV